MPSLHTPDQFKTRPALLAMGVAGLVLGYLLLTRALDTASGWQYLGTFVLVILGTRLMARGLKTKK